MGEVPKRNKNVKYPPEDPSITDERIIQLWTEATTKKIHDFLDGQTEPTGGYDNIHQIIEDSLTGALDDYWGVLADRVKIKRKYRHYGAAIMNEGRR